MNSRTYSLLGGIATVTALAMPVPIYMAEPVNNNVGIFNDHLLLIVYSTAFLMLLVSWLKIRNGADAYLTSFFFGILFLSFWTTKVPNGELLGSSWNYAAIVSSVNAAGAVKFTAGTLESYPSAYLVLTTLLKMSGANIADTFFLYAFLRIIVLSSFFFLISRILTDNPRASCLVSCLAIVASIYAVRLPDSPFSPNAYGTTTFFVSLYLLLKYAKSPTRQDVPLLLVSFFGNVLGYLLTPFVILLTLLFITVGVVRSGKPRAASMIKRIVFPLVIVFGTTYSIINLIGPNGGYFVGNWFAHLLLSLEGHSPPVPASGSLLSKLNEYVGRQPIYLGVEVLLWLVVTYVIGGTLWLVKSVRRFDANDGACLALSITFVLLLLFGAANSDRILVLIPIFFSASLVNRLSSIKQNQPKVAPKPAHVNRLSGIKGKFALYILAVLVFMLALPTVISYYSASGFSTAYDSNISSGNFIAFDSCNPELYTPTGIAPTAYPTNYLLLKEFYPYFIGSGNSLQENTTASHVLANVNNFFNSYPCSLFDSSQAYFGSLVYIYGKHVGGNIQQDMIEMLSNYDVIYTNQFNTFYVVN